ncbi:MAG: DNA polymerase III subunit delta [Candidatus Kerfeldbacteria bacterium]|nr:DNA polymerase III subunit delta [Candidatus Kerfeldbacteria bacterium]
MIIFLYGPDSFRIHERVQTLRQGFIKKYDQSAVSVTQLRGDDVTLDQLHSALLTQGLLTKKRLVVLHQALAMAEAAISAVLSILEKIDDDTVLVATSSTISKPATALSKCWLKSDRVEEYSLLTGTALTQWIKQRVQQYQATITTEAIFWLTQAIGSDLWRMHQVITQLAHYQPAITITTAQLFTEAPLDDNIFHLLDAITRRDTKTALHLLHQQLASGANIFYIVTMLARQITTMVRVQDSQGKDPDIHPYVIKKTYPIVQTIPTKQLNHLAQVIIELDVALKSTTTDPAVLLDRCIVQATDQLLLG